MTGSFVGNDIVDLSDPRCADKARDERFIERIFDPAEATLIGRSATPDRTLWRLWAAKEAAFKVVSKRSGAPPPFVHARFVTRLSERDGVHGHVHYGTTVVPFILHEDRATVQAIAWSRAADLHVRPRPGPPRSLTHAAALVAQVLPGLRASELSRLLQDRFTERERVAVHSLASAAVRIAAREGAAMALGVDPTTVEILCAEGAPGRTPPTLAVDGVASRMDVSLSHHGSWVAWALLAV